MTRNYQGVCLPSNLLQRIDEISKNLGYTSRADFIKESIREKLAKIDQQE